MLAVFGSRRTKTASILRCPRTDLLQHYRYDPDDPATISRNAVNTLAVDRTNRLWIGTNGYDFAVITKKTVSFAMKPCLCPVRSFSGSSLKNDRLWITTDRGLIVFYPATGQLKRYSRADGLHTEQFMSNSGILTFRRAHRAGYDRWYMYVHPPMTSWAIEPLSGHNHPIFSLTDCLYPMRKTEARRFRFLAEYTRKDHAVAPPDLGGIPFRFANLPLSGRLPLPLPTRRTRRSLVHDR